MASFRKLDNGTWQGTIYLGRDPKTKKQDRCYVTRDTLKECKAAAREIEQEKECGALVNIPNMRLSEWVDQWMGINKGRLAPSTFTLYRSYEKNYWSILGDRKLKDITEPMIQKFMNAQLKPAGKLSNTSCGRMISPLRLILSDALKHKSPARDIKLPTRERPDHYVLSNTEMSVIHDFFKGTRDEPIVLLAAWCGLRRGEIFALRWDDIDWNKKILRIDEALSINEDCQYNDKRTKSENGMRTVPVPQYLLDLLEDLKKEKMTGRLKKKKQPQVIPQIIPDDHRIFSLRPDSYSSYFAKKIANNNLPPVSFHELRHHFVSWLYANNIPDQMAAELVGDNIKTMKGIYQHMAEDYREEINNKIQMLHAERK